MSLGRSGDSEWRTWSWRSWRRWRRWRILPRPTPPWSSPAPVRNTSSRWSRDLRQSTTSGQPRGTELTASTASTQPRSGKLETLLEKCDHIDVNRRYLPETISIQLFVSRYIYFQNFQLLPLKVQVREWIYTINTFRQIVSSWNPYFSTASSICSLHPAGIGHCFSGILIPKSAKVTKDLCDVRLQQTND